MKHLILLVITISTLGVYAGIKSELVPMYQVISDTADAKVPEGKCLITGVITREGQTINEALIYSTSGIKVNSNKIGKFRIIVDTADTYLVIHKSPFKDAFVEYLKFNNQHHIDLKIFMPLEEEMIMVEKPVIYAYAPSQTAINIKLSTNEDFTFTYPQISDLNSWSFYTANDGAITLKDKEYPYLFWESKTEKIEYIKNENAIEGNVVKDELVISFLEKQLDILGLNEREQTDFITYWAPRMTQHKYALVQFVVDEGYDNIAKIDITPSPQSLRRVYMLFTPFNDYPNQYKIKSQILRPTSIDRTGLTIIEWGGSEIPQSNLNSQL